MKTLVYAKICTRMFTAELLFIALNWKQPNGLQQVQEENRGMRLQWDIQCHKQEGTGSMCNNFSGSQSE